MGILLALLAVLATPERQGAQRWFPLGPLQLQPSEFATLVLIIAIATYCSRRPEGLDFRDLVRLVLMAALPILLVFKQPDLGTAIVMTVILMVMLAVAGMPGPVPAAADRGRRRCWCCSPSTSGCSSTTRSNG